MSVNLLEAPAAHDPGDETQRNFRYQHAYGAILLINASAGTLPYIALYAEYHEDFLCERSDGQFDAIQVKTREDGEKWRITHEALRHSIKKFTSLEAKYGDAIHAYHFVSNASYYVPSDGSTNLKHLGASPIHLSNSVIASSCPSMLQEPFSTVFKDLADYCSCSDEMLFSVLKKLRLIDGPSRKDFDDVLCSTHLGPHELCKNYPMSVLIGIRDELVHKVWHASSMVVSDPAKHWFPVNTTSPMDPILQAKRIDVSYVTQVLATRAQPPFRYSLRHAALKIDDDPRDLPRMRKKMYRGEVADQVQILEWQVDSTYDLLMERAYTDPTNITAELAQIEGAVLSECNEAYNEAYNDVRPFGREMLTCTLGFLS